MASTALALSAVPTSAAAATWYVGVDGAGDGGCSRPRTRTIQAAIDRVSAGDTIVVCPGRYTGPLRIEGRDRDGLTIRADEPGSVRILSPARGARYVEALISVEDARDVRLEGLDLVVRGARPCRSVWTVVSISGESPRATVIGSRIRVARSDTTRLRRGCGYQSGILGATVVASNVIEDWGLGQISGTGIGAGPGSLVIGNVLRFEHPDEHTLDWEDSHVGIAASGGFIVGNHILGRITSSVPGETPGTPVMTAGIALEGDAIVVGNTIDYATAGIEAGGPDVLLANLVRDSRWIGIELYGSGGALVALNAVEGSEHLDCFEVSAEAYEAESGEAWEGPNAWIGNTGATSDPVGVCVPR